MAMDFSVVGSCSVGRNERWKGGRGGEERSGGGTSADREKDLMRTLETLTKTWVFLMYLSMICDSFYHHHHHLSSPEITCQSACVQHCDVSFLGFSVGQV